MYKINKFALTLVLVCGNIKGGVSIVKIINYVAGILQEELESKLKIQKEYEDELVQFESLPKGNVYIKTFGNKDYFYYQYRCSETKKGRTVYMPMEQGIALKKQTDRRQYLEKALKPLRKEITTIEKMLKPIGKKPPQADNISEKLQEIRAGNEYVNLERPQILQTDSSFQLR